ncbi:MAG: hypothetical protein Q9157_006591 [Trypethelium eluteriae]
MSQSLVNWIGREGINQSDFTYCLERSSGVAYPNDRGLTIRQDISKSNQKITQVGGLNLIASGAVGRAMAFSEDHAYIVTTVAAATKHKDMRFATFLLCEMIEQAEMGPQGKPEQSQLYWVKHNRLLGVLSKVVESVSLNVINAGHTLGDLPAELKDLCVHVVDAKTYAGIVVKLVQSTSDCLLLCERFQADLLLWILAHFEGNVKVSLSGTQIFERAGSRGKRNLSMMIEKTCSEPHTSPGNTKSCVELLELRGDTYTRLRQGHAEAYNGYSTGHRLPLYASDHPEDKLHRTLNREERYEVRVLAQRLVLWMLDIPIRSLRNGFLNFETYIPTNSSSINARIGDILRRWPKILHDSSGKNLGDLTPISFLPLDSEQYNRRDYGSELSSLPPLNLTCECFPPPMDLLDEVSNRCKCRTCRIKGSIDECKEGCIRWAVLSHLFVLFGNSIADGFGVQDVSSLCPLSDYTRALGSLLGRLVQGDIYWHEWFDIAASTALGFSPRTAEATAQTPDVWGAGLVAIQHGSNVAVSKWLDMNRRTSLEECFGIEIAEGQIPGVQDECAFIRVETFGSLMGFSENFSDLDKGQRCQSYEDYRQWLQALSEAEPSSVKLQHATLVSAKPNESLLVTVVSVGSSQKLVDPTRAITERLCCTRLATVSDCGKHTAEWLQEHRQYVDDEILKEVYLWTLENLLSGWGFCNSEKQSQIFVTQGLDSELKVNIALSLGFGGCYLKETTSCLLCALKDLEVHQGARQLGKLLPRIIQCHVDETAVLLR